MKFNEIQCNRTYGKHKIELDNLKDSLRKHIARKDIMKSSYTSELHVNATKKFEKCKAFLLYFLKEVIITKNNLKIKRN